MSRSSAPSNPSLPSSLHASSRFLAAAILLAIVSLGTLGCSCGDPSSDGGEAEGAELADSAEPRDGVAGEGGEGEDDVEGDGEDEGSGESSVAPLQRETVRIYFPSALADGLVAERREIFATTTPGDRIKQIVNDLISGPATPDALRALPRGTQLRQVFVVDGGTAYLDFNGELTDGSRGGSTRELLIVYSIVDSVVLNVRDVKRVALLVNGQPLDTLNGHVDLRKPLRANTSLVLRGSV